MTSITQENYRKIILTGITPSGAPHVGNYIGAIKPALEMAKNPQIKSCFFIADYHSLIKLWDPKSRQEYIYDIAATWLSLGLDPEKTIFYRQSDITEILELYWILTSVTAKGLLNRTHAYKAILDYNRVNNKKNFDQGVTMGLFNYPILMAADMIAFNTDLVPVGKDQIQHVEIARDIANRFNNIYCTQLLKAPKVLVDHKTQTIPGIDGRKMSKSYNNTIPLFAESKKLRKLIMKIVTNSQPSNEAKLIQNCTIFSLYQHFSTQNEIIKFEKYYKQGICWKEAKSILFEKMDKVLKPARQRYKELIAKPKIIDRHLKLGAEKARESIKRLLKKIKETVGI